MKYITNTRESARLARPFARVSVRCARPLAERASVMCFGFCVSVSVFVSQILRCVFAFLMFRTDRESELLARPLTYV